MLAERVVVRWHDLEQVRGSQRVTDSLGLHSGHRNLGEDSQAQAHRGPVVVVVQTQVKMSCPSRGSHPLATCAICS